ncbi:unnamed protein product [Mytilus coruscus]|uniref:Uncharacterized protein n=1 Tax=Mytilus coruscus TaxID=42192 RepID=A0A6J8B7V2_MYTCO|nr:unnamed protein product [Mytilus coruscus]
MDNFTPQFHPQEAKCYSSGVITIPNCPAMNWKFQDMSPSIHVSGEETWHSVVKPYTKKLPECNKTNTQSNGIQTDSFKHYPRLHGQPKTKSATSIVRFAEAEKFISEATPPKVNADREKEHGTGWSTVCRKRKGKRPSRKTSSLDRISVSKGDSSIRTTAMELDLRSPRSRRKHRLV